MDTRCYRNLALNRYIKISRLYPVFRNQDTILKSTNWRIPRYPLFIRFPKTGPAPLLHREQQVVPSAASLLIFYLVVGKSIKIRQSLANSYTRKINNFQLVPAKHFRGTFLFKS